MKTMKKMGSSSSLEKRVYQRKGSSLHQARKEENPPRRDKILRKHQTVRKKKGHQARKDFNKKRDSSSCERILIHQKTWETWDSMKDHSSWEGWAKMKIHQEKKFNQIEEDEEKKK